MRGDCQKNNIKSLSIVTTQGWAPGPSAQQCERRRGVLGLNTAKEMLRVSDLDYMVLAIPQV